MWWTWRDRREVCAWRTGAWGSVVSVLAAGAGAVGAGAGVPDIATVRVASGLTEPISLAFASGDHDRLFVAERTGRVRIVREGVVLAPPFLDISDLVLTTGPRGLLSLAMHPDHMANGLFYVNYIDMGGANVIAQYQALAADPDVADPGSAVVVLRLPQPALGHNIEWIAFGPDGYLYVAGGDGGVEPCPLDRAQDLSVLYGKLLRIDVDCDDFPDDPLRNYGIPPTNPFVGVAGVREEVWAYGLRQPWRCEFDVATGDLYIADVGADALEELNVQPAGSRGGENYGWACMEGSICGPGAACGPPGGPSCACGDGSLVLPLYEYPHDPPDAYAIIGGIVYRGCGIPGLDGAYLYNDWNQNRIYALRHDGQQVTLLQDVSADLDPPGALDLKRVASFGLDAAAEAYILDFIDGELFKIVAEAAFPDCNGNGVDDSCDIAAGASVDADADGVPDECQACPWDLDGGGHGRRDRPACASGRLGHEPLRSARLRWRRDCRHRGPAGAPDRLGFVPIAGCPLAPGRSAGPQRPLRGAGP